MSNIAIYTDGGARGNPGPAGAGAVIYDQERNILGEVSEYLGERTNNWAEYEALIRALELARDLELTAHKVRVFLDSKLVVEQVMGNWKIKEPTLKEKAARAIDLVALFKDISLQHVPRAENAVADTLANKAMDRGE